MRFYTKDECEGWLRERERAKPDCIPEIHRAHVHYPTSPGRILYLAHWVAGSLMYRDPALVWITEWGIWGSSENWHLYYKLRQSYGDLGDPRLEPLTRCLTGRRLLEFCLFDLGSLQVRDQSFGSRAT